MKISIAIVNYNQKYFPRLCLEALDKSVFKDFEIIVCDNNSSDESIGFLREAAKKGEIKLIESRKNIGYGAGVNLAAKHANGEYLVVLNTDIIVELSTLGRLLEYAEKHADIGLIGPKLVYHNGTVQQSCRRNFRLLDLFIKRTFLKKLPWFRKRYEKYIMADFNHDETQEVELITGAFMMIPRSIFEEVGGFDERYFLFMEDFDLCKKVAAKGRKIVYYPVAKATHYHKRLSEGGFLRLVFSKVSWLHLISAVKYHWKWR